MSLPVLKTGTNNNLHHRDDNLGNFVMLLLVFKELFSKAFMIAFIYTVHSHGQIVGSNTAVKGLKYCIYNKEDIVMDAYKDYHALMANIALLNIEDQFYNPEELLSLEKSEKMTILHESLEENSIELHPYTEAMTENIKECYISIYEEAKKIIETKNSSPANAAIVAFNEYILAELNMAVFSDAGSDNSSDYSQDGDFVEKEKEIEIPIEQNIKGNGGEEEEEEEEKECTSSKKCGLCSKIDEAVEKWNDWDIETTEEEEYWVFFAELKKLVSLMDEFITRH